MIKPDLLIIGTSKDLHIDLVINHLNNYKISICRLNIDKFPKKSSLSINISNTIKRKIVFIDENENIFSLEDISAVWFRRIGAPQLDENIKNKAHKAFALGEIESTLNNLVFLLRSAFWISDYQSTKRASCKLFQLEIANEVGLDTPNETLLSNNPDSTLDFYNKNLPIIYKTLHSPSVIYEHNRKLIFSQKLTPKNIDKLQQVKYAPCQFQTHINKKYELRITFVGDKIHTVKIDSQSHTEAIDDWRRADNRELAYSEYILPKKIIKRIYKLMDIMNLHYGAIDIIVTNDNRYIFLEVNPHGAWGWLEKGLNLPISLDFSKFIYKSTINNKPI